MIKVILPKNAQPKHRNHLGPSINIMLLLLFMANLASADSQLNRKSAITDMVELEFLGRRNRMKRRDSVPPRRPDSNLSRSKPRGDITDDFIQNQEKIGFGSQKPSGIAEKPRCLNSILKKRIWTIAGLSVPSFIFAYFLTKFLVPRIPSSLIPMLEIVTEGLWGVDAFDFIFIVLGVGITTALWVFLAYFFRSTFWFFGTGVDAKDHDISPL
jgi:hypothetical protein